MPRRFLAVLLAAAALAACRHDSPDREPVEAGPAPSMADAAPPRFGQDLPAPEPSKALPAARPRDERQPPRPPADIPNVGPNKDALAAGFDAARKQATAPRPEIGAAPQALMSVPLSQLIGIHLARSPLKVRGDDNAEYAISAQSGRLGEQKAYVVISRGAGTPGAADIGSLRRDLGGILPVGGSIDHVDVDGRRFGVAMHASASDGACAAVHPSEIEIWASTHHDPAHTRKITVSGLFAETAKAGVALRGAKGQATLVAYRDVPFQSGKISVAVFEAGGGMTPVPAELLTRSDGKVVALALHGAPAQRFGLRISGAGGAQTLDVFDLSAGGQKPAAVDLNALAPQKPCS